MSKKQSTKLITGDILKSSLLGSIQKLSPRRMMKNPVMFVVEIGFFVTLLLTAFPGIFGDTGSTEQMRLYSGIVSAILLLTL
ncbi:MAG: potassium-transporting ATPase subunit B, partial [Ruthenibacterium sp.]